MFSRKEEKERSFKSKRSNITHISFTYPRPTQFHWLTTQISISAVSNTTNKRDQLRKNMYQSYTPLLIKTCMKN